ncbi:unnamed protein product [Mesocestoides corti]|uniref:CUB domain-containing protein n=1 Tax=Mesocestoides corti TaxID=53468 RepID=A0A0R3UBV4_MESCO|nr:unnamed protein product [Mesocestoides corti]
MLWNFKDNDPIHGPRSQANEHTTILAEHVLEFQPDASTFNGSHETYCPITVSGPPCPPAGLFDISQCSLPGQISPPIYASMPHFLHGHADLRAPFKGLRKANPRIDTVKLLVEPVGSCFLIDYAEAIYHT